jgi:hypothetical protein
MLLGLERGERVGRNTLTLVAAALGRDVSWIYDHLYGVQVQDVPVRVTGRDTTPITADSVGGGSESLPPGRPLELVRESAGEPEEDNEVLAAIRRDKVLSPEAKAHFLNQYELLAKLSRIEKTDIPQRYVAETPRTGYDPELEREIDEDVRRAGRDNPDSPYRDT